MSKFDKLREAIYADRFDGRIKAIKEAFEEYEKRLGLSLWQRAKRWFKKKWFKKGGKI